MTRNSALLIAAAQRTINRIMLQRTTSRLTALGLATLFLLSTMGEALGRSCTHHEPQSTSSAEVSAEHSQHHTTPDHNDICTCIGDCCGAPTRCIVSGDEVRLLAATQPAATERTPESETDLPGPAPFTLPLANAPPRAR